MSRARAGKGPDHRAGHGRAPGEADEEEELVFGARATTTTPPGMTRRLARPAAKPAAPAAQPARPLLLGDAVLRPIRGGNAFEETVERILQLIKLGVVDAGERLPPERELSVRLGVSRVTLREAIRALQEAGYVESRRGRYGGTFVRRADVPDVRAGQRRLSRPADEVIDDVLTLREVLEVGAAEMAARRRLSPDERRHLSSRLAETNAARLRDYRRLDSRLHLAIAEATGSASLTSCVVDVRMRLNDLLDAIPLLRRNIEHSNRQHEEIVAAILAGDPPIARRSMEEHVAGSAALLRGFLG
jgi:DNA-binding FadR family transcriptional regulator